ncbi:MarR family winged helix-turn-helix transcriptional regulator [Streptomyces sp. B1866]|uniref:MarR family winged helix-turn-helix transcriptional regulator n=1 Tax=Streptomyces sp. B1866 TaxID=3075431 RepID=UPI0028903C1D|nr:MarR family winged helix-turn-helix transcriptional regulator [Streptomyces sp. B1866]MDT3395516.1 MarR family winged helix-turn-helix transcriptional regulator [Streptomyces sp. B1866]
MGGEVVVEETEDVSRTVGRVGRLHAGVAATLLHDLGLYPGQELLLMRLWERDHQTQTELTVALGLDPSTVTRTVQCLQRSALVTRTPSPTDRRAVIVSLTPEGDALRTRVEEFWRQLEAATTGEMSDRQRDSALRLLRRVEANLTSSPRAETTR